MRMTRSAVFQKPPRSTSMASRRGRTKRRWTAVLVVVVAGALTLTGMAGPALADRGNDRDQHNAFRQVNLVSDIPGLAGVEDPLLINPWGIAFSATSPLWTSNQGSNPSTLYSGTTRENATKVPPAAPLVVRASSPTGIVFNSTPEFVIPQGSKTAAATFIFNETTFDAT